MAEAKDLKEVKAQAERHKVFEKVIKSNDYKEFRTLRDMMEEYRSITYLLNPKKTGFNKDFSDNLTSALDHKRMIPLTHIKVWHQNIEALLINKREELYNLIIDKASDKGIFNDMKEIL